MNKQPSDAQEPQGGYGTPSPEDEMPPSPKPARGAAKEPGADHAGQATAGQGANRDAGTPEDAAADPGDPLLEPLEPSDTGDSDPEVSKGELREATTVEPPD